SLAAQGLLGTFIGMLTDSRSLLSYVRHDYFRRILCEFLGDLVDAGEYPNDPQLLETLVKDISYRNSLAYFGLEIDV
ncbi:MAG TPA: glucuronate isomerase, partial [Anaerovoracaceae bacterium]|nr:glucuronate isomerase [Anaerovoracaceae bacterium]